MVSLYYYLSKNVKYLLFYIFFLPVSSIMYFIFNTFLSLTGQMSKLLALLCGIFALYAASFANGAFVSDEAPLQCQLSRNSPSTIIAEMDDPFHRDVSDTDFSVLVVAQKVQDAKYRFASCVVRTNVGQGNDEENTYVLQMQEYDNPAEPITSFGGQSKFRPNSSLGQFKVYCSLVAPDATARNVEMSLTLRFGCKSYTQSSTQCQILPYNNLWSMLMANRA